MSVDVEVLVREHKTAVTTDEGIVFHTVPSLLGQLRDAVYAGMERGGSSSAFSPRLPIDAGALDLRNLIDDQITRAWVAAFNRVPNADRIESLLTEWAAWADDDTVVHTSDHTWVYANTAVADWIRRVEDFLNPPNNVPIKAPCVACGTEWVYRQQDGETIRRTAMTFHRDRKTGDTLYASCEVCEITWGPDRFKWLAEQIAKTPNQQIRDGSEK